MRAPRVLVAGAVLGQPMGGVRRHNAELLPRVARLLVEHGGALAVLEGRGGLAFELPPEIERLRSSVPSGPPLRRALAEGRALRDALSRAHFDLVHTAHLPAPRRIGVPYTLTIHDLRSFEDAAGAWIVRRRVARRVVGPSVARAARVFTVSETVAASLERHMGCARPTVIGNGCDHFAPLPRAAPPGAPLVHLGHVEPRKNLELVVRALAADPGLPDVELWGAAKDSEDARLSALARELGVAQRVRLRGAYEDRDLPRILATCAAVVLPSRLEGFGIPALEAQRALAPLAVSSAGALPEVAGPGVPTFAPGDPAACAAAIRAALARPITALERDRERASAFTWDRAARRWFEGWIAVAEPAAD